jgi:peptide-methionine (S)-S-oxide reductase
MAGVVRTRVGYAGGTTEDPTYTSIGDHTETVEIEFDPSVIGYADLLDVFFGAHRPESVPWCDQYRNVVFTHGEDQRVLAEQKRDEIEAELGLTIHTAIEEAGPFYQAEDYHQKYQLQHFGELMAEFEAMYPSFDDLVRSTAAARVNGYIPGNGTLEQLEVEIDGFGLSPAGKVLLLDFYSRRL